MNNRMIRVGVAFLALTLAACSATVGAAGSIKVPKDSPTTCANFCADMGMSLGAVVVMASNVGCVCNPAGSTKTHGSAEQGAAAGAGMAAVLIQEAQQRQGAQQGQRR